MSKWMKKSKHFSTNSSYTPQFMARQFVSPTFPNSKCWICDSIKGPFPVVSAFLNHSLTQIWSPLNSNPDLVSWRAAPQNSEWVIYQFLEWWETKWFMAQPFFFLSFFCTQILFMSLLSSPFLTLISCLFCFLSVLCFWLWGVTQSLTVNLNVCWSSG